MKKISIVESNEFDNIEKDDNYISRPAKKSHNRIIDSNKQITDNSSDNNLRPKIWDDYIGQEQIKKNMKTFIGASKMRGECLDHILFCGPPGLGKTTLSYIIAEDMNANIKVSSAPMIEKTGDLAAIMTNLDRGDILFIDEIHRLSPAIEEVLYPAMEDFRLDIIIGQGAAAQTMKIDLAPFTLIGATTRVGMLSNPLRDRFGINFRLEFYSIDELALIVKRASHRLNKKITDESAKEIAKRSRGTPRIALRLLKRIRDFADVKHIEEISHEIAKYGLDELGVNSLGFDMQDIKYLTILMQSKGKAIGLTTLSAAMSEDEGTIEDVIEPYLLANGYIERTAKGRIATAKTFEIFNIKNNLLF